MLPVIALVGRPNVGKSTLFNQLTRSRDALVADYAGLTRDRKYGEGRLGDRDYIVVDTGGISGDEDGIDSHMAEQSLTAIDEADVVLFLVDARAGLTAADEMIADYLRRSHKKAHLVLNKTDGIDEDAAAAEFFSIGMGTPLPIAASHSKGVRQLIDYVLEEIPEVEDEFDSEPEEPGIKMAIVGRPNVGKSTLVNRMLGEERVVVFDQAGTTRDSIYIPYERFEQRYTLIDTAGVRRRGKVHETVEKFSVIKTLKAMEDANVVILVLDAREGIVEQDLHMLGFVLDSGRSLVIAVNKWDGMSNDEREDVKRELDRRLNFVDFARIHFISAMHGTNVGHLYESVEEAYESAMGRWTSNQLTRILEDAVATHQPPMVRGHRIKLRYCHMGGSNPPTLIIHGNQVDSIPQSYVRYLENTFRNVLKLMGTPMKINFKGSENPFADKQRKEKVQQNAKKRQLDRSAQKRMAKAKAQGKKVVATKKAGPNKRKNKARV
ncbi:ribosome biogenesis GTPase Der [Parendozoicomonas haliclonae]|uniref:GTPase Der n=1 Tax=Parendozoicomonas haliclonae TaxID=1960125 RepID=A0A1X7AE93_9GAMM|nr:ribosome biogenesis GTPase Der [Parendozoicomonas haliclonae]SMA33715.1 GTPase Der [Parendozoicomonas haliclonae]